MSAKASILMSVFDELEYGLVVLDKDFQARFINRGRRNPQGQPDLRRRLRARRSEWRHPLHQLCPVVLHVADFSADLPQFDLACIGRYKSWHTRHPLLKR
jgi:hypothetical protein